MLLKVGQFSLYPDKTRMSFSFPAHRLQFFKAFFDFLTALHGFSFLFLFIQPASSFRRSAVFAEAFCITGNSTEYCDIKVPSFMKKGRDDGSRYHPVLQTLAVLNADTQM